MTLPKEGHTAPAFATQDDSGKQVKLAEYHGRWVVLFFYPKDDSPG